LKLSAVMLAVHRGGGHISKEQHIMRYIIVLAAVLVVTVSALPAVAADNANDFRALSKMTH
jgi:hypothetical protein